MSDNRSLYEKLGGEAAVNAAVDIFYKKVLADKRIQHFFDGIDMPKQIKKQKAFLTMAFGGPNQYSGVGLRNAHKRLVEEKGLNGSHFDAVAQNLIATLDELNVPKDLADQVIAIAASTREEVLAGDKRRSGTK